MVVILLSFIKRYKTILLIILIVISFIIVLILNSIKIPIIKVNAYENKIDINSLHNYKIQAYYPNTIYNNLNKFIDKNIKSYIYKFFSDIKDFNVQQDQYYTLYITYDSYIYQNYLSYVFYIEYYTGGAHPNHEIWTVNYDTKLNKVITTSDLIYYNPNILKTFSKISRNNLINNERIVDINMLMSGTEPIKDNFKSFVFSNNGLIIFFERYQVAPYSSGDFKLTIPYNQIYKDNHTK